MNDDSQTTRYDAIVLGGGKGGKTLAALAGQQIKLRFSLVNTDLYSYRVGWASRRPAPGRASS